jgi:hypothetical protein
MIARINVLPKETRVQMQLRHDELAVSSMSNLYIIQLNTRGKVHLPGGFESYCLRGVR